MMIQFAYAMFVYLFKEIFPIFVLRFYPATYYFVNRLDQDIQSFIGRKTVVP